MRHRKFRWTRNLDSREVTADSIETIVGCSGMEGLSFSAAVRDFKEGKGIKADRVGTRASQRGLKFEERFPVLFLG